VVGASGNEPAGLGGLPVWKRPKTRRRGDPESVQANAWRCARRMSLNIRKVFMYRSTSPVSIWRIASRFSFRYSLMEGFIVVQCEWYLYSFKRRAKLVVH
jgi:hypothetical protein